MPAEGLDLVPRLLDFRDLIWALVARELKVRYRRSAIGFLWTMLQPLLTMLVLQVAFSALFRFDVPNYPVYVLAGVLLWNFLSQSVVAAMNSLRGNAQLLKKVPVPKEVFPIATVASGLVNLLFALVPLLLILVATGHPLRPSLLFLPVAIVIATVFVLGAGLLLSPLAAFFHDVVEMVGVALTMLMYLTPVFYPFGIIPERLRSILRFNPLRVILEVFRIPIYEGRVPPLTMVLVAAGLAAASFLIGRMVFRRSCDRTAFYL